jgi:hydrogenase maturation protease
MFLIIGYGNVLRGDDGVGQHVAQRLEDTCDSEMVHVIACHQLTPERVEAISRAHMVIFMDATEEGKPGEIRCQEIRPEATAGAFTHNVTPATLLAVSRDLYGVSPKGITISITGAHFDYGEGLSPPVEKAVPEVMKRLCQLMERHENLPTMQIQSQKSLEA